MNSDKLKRVIEHYHQKAEPKYAIMIDGAWGSGKTHFINEYIENYPNNKFIYVSLYGVTTTTQIEDNIFASIIGTSDATDSEIKKAGDFIGKVFGAFGDKAEGSAVGALASLSGDAFKKRALKNISQNTILIFDDLERAELPQHQCLSKINEYVEHQKLKVIILCDENKVNDSKYFEYKEKVVLHTNQFERTPEEIVDICFASCQELKCNKLIEFKKELKWVIEHCSLKNIRTIQHGLSCFIEVANKLHDLDFEYKDSSVLCELIFPSIAYSVGYKDFSVPTIELEKTSIDSTAQAVAYHMKEKHQEISNKWDHFYAKILSKVTKRMEFRSIFELVCKGDLNEEFILLDIQNWELKEYGLDHPITNFRMDEVIEDGEFSKAIEDALSVLDITDYQFYSTAELFQFCKNIYFLYEHKAFEYGGIFEEKLNSFASNAVNYCLNHTEPSAFGCKESEGQFINQLFDMLNLTSEKLNKVKETSSAKSQLQQALENNEPVKIKAIKEYFSTRSVIDKHFVSYFMETLPAINNVTLREFGIFLRNRYESETNFINLKDEISAIQFLLTELEQYLEATNNSLSTMMVSLVKDTVKDICARGSNFLDKAKLSEQES